MTLCFNNVHENPLVVVMDYRCQPCPFLTKTEKPLF